MTQREAEILNIIKENPLISQQEIADMLGVTRSSIAVHITNLSKKGIIMGKGYVVKGDEYVSVIGGANIDIQGFPDSTLKLCDSNPGSILLSAGGVGRNIAENIARLGLHTRFFTFLGDDLYGEKIMKESQRAGIDMSHIETLQGESTGAYLSVLDETGDMKVAISHMAIYDRMNREFIDRKKIILERSSLIVLDTNLPEDVIRYILSSMGHKKFIIDMVSTTKAVRIRDMLGSFHTVKPNRLEAEALSGIEINGRASLESTADFFHTKGVQNVFISLGADGTYYSDNKSRGILKANKLKIVNATGAGDAFVAGLVLGNLREWDIEEKTRFAIGASLMALAHKDTINPYISEENINQIVMEADIC